MKHCRTCKYWSLEPQYIGLGICMNLDAMSRVKRMHGSLDTSHDFGCNQHEPGKAVGICSEEDEVSMIREFVLERYDIVIPR